MIKKQNKTLLHSYLIILLFFTIDRILKYCALNQKAVGSNLPNGFFNFAKNTGVAFSIPIPQTILYFIVITILILLVSISVKYFKQKKYFLHFLTLLLIAGAVSNLIDRIKFGYVIDYIDFKFWPVFNLADVMIVVGVGLWIWKISRQEKRPSNIERPRV